MKKNIIISIAVLTALSLSLSGCGVFSILKAARDNSGPENGTMVIEPETDPMTAEVSGFENFEPKEEEPKEEEPVAKEQNTDENAVTTLKNGDMILVSKGTLIYDVFTMTIPDAWDQRVYAVAGENYISFHQAMSYDIEEYMGYLISFAKAENQVPCYAGEVNLAYSDQYFYYSAYPTDVPYDYEDAENTQDYNELAMAEDRLIESLVIDDAGVSFDVEDFICPMSSSKPIPEEMFYNMNGDEIKRARDEIYARHGQVFNDYFLQNYFDSCSWYERSRDDELTQGDFSEVEWNNIELLSQKLYEWQQENPYPIYVYAMDNEVTDVLNENQGQVSISYYVTTDDEGYVGHICLAAEDGVPQNYSTRDYGIELENPEESCFYITAINPYYGGHQVAIFDFGNDDNNMTYFFTVNDNGEFVYIGTISGCPFEGLAGASCNGFATAGRVQGTVRTYILGNESYYQSCWFNPGELEFEFDDYSQEYDMVPSPGKITKKALTIYKIYDDGEEVPMEIEAGTEVFFKATNGKNTVTLKTKDGRVGVLRVTADMSSNPEEYFEFK